MPHLNGYEVLEQLKDLIPSDSYFPILVLTADATPPAKMRALAAGAKDFLTKPFDQLEVLLRIKNLLETRTLHLNLHHYNESLEHSVRERTIELEKTLDELRATQQQVIQQERLHALGLMASGVAHDFNNALSLILGFSELVTQDLEAGVSPVKILKSMQTVIRAASDAARMVDRLREFHRPADSDLKIPVDLNALAEQAADFTKPKWSSQALGSGVSIEIKTELGDVPRVAGDPAELREVLTNLIFNAVDAMPDGGVITLRTRRDEESVVIEVRDTGSGMTEEVRQRCLDPFFTTKGKRGTGLGLAMVYGIIKRHGGDVAIESALGRGTSFIVRLPMALDDAAPAAGEIEKFQGCLHILVVDDQEVLRDITVQFLEHDGHTAEQAGDGREGLAIFARGHFDLVITDQAMPDMNGDQLAVAIKALKPETPILMATGFGDAGDEVSPAVDFILAKPFSVSSLRQAIVRVLQGRGAATGPR
jgi:signal transduction histidine kinase